MSQRLSIPSIVLAIVLTVVVFSLVSHLEDVAGAASVREARGLTRGPFLDRFGKPLVYTVGTVRARRLSRVPDLADVVGFQDPGGKWHGLEAQYSSFLEGSGPRHEWSTFFLHLAGKTIEGGRVRLTLDRRLQQTAAAALGHATGAVVALDPRTGSVLALVSAPSCALATLSTRQGYAECSRRPDHPLENRPTRRLVAPGSSFKIVTLTAALDTGQFSLNSIFSGADVFGPSPYFNNETYPSNVTRSDLTQLTLAQALAFSDNFTFAHIGLTLGASTLLRYAHRYRVGTNVPFDLAVAPSRVADGETHPDKSVLAQSSFGAPVDRVTPLQMALIAETVANGGIMMAPHLVRDLETANGKVVYQYPDHVLSHVMSSATARQVTEGMTFVVDHGSGLEAQIVGVKVAGKTGTAASSGSRPHAWFIAFAPAYHPVVAVAVLHEFSGEGFDHAAPIARRMLIAALREHGFHVH